MLQYVKTGGTFNNFILHFGDQLLGVSLFLPDQQIPSSVTAQKNYHVCYVTNYLTEHDGTFLTSAHRISPKWLRINGA